MPDSQYNLAILYERGLGLKTDIVKAYQWYALAAERGDAKAEKSRDALARKLSAKKKAELDSVVASWQRRRPDPKVNGVAPEPPADAPATVGSITNNAASSSLQTAKAEPVLDSENIGKHSLVLEAQRYLFRLGYDTGPMDGVAGERTVSAVRRFQSRNGFAPTGRITEDLVVRLAAMQG